MVAATIACTSLAAAQSPTAFRTADSLLNASDSIRALGQRAGSDSSLVRLRLALRLVQSARLHAASASEFTRIFSLRRTDRWAFDSAIAHADSALAIDPRYVRAMWERATAVGLNGDRAARIAGYERALAVDSTFPLPIGLLISDYDDAGRPGDAMTLGERILVLQPRNFQAQFRLGWSYARIWEHDKAVRLFERLASDTGARVYRAWAQGELAYLARSRGDFADAVRHMEAATQMVPTDLVSQLGLAMMLLTSGDAARARPLIDRALARDSNATGYGSYSGRLLMAWAARDLKDSTLARRMFADADRLFVANTAAGLNQSRFLASAYALEGRRADALAILTRLNGGGFYGGPDEHEGSISSLRGDPEFEASLAKGREAQNALRRTIGLPAVAPEPNHSAHHPALLLGSVNFCNSGNRADSRVRQLLRARGSR